MKRNGGVPAIILLCFFLSGVAGLAYEVVWIRQLSLIFGTTSFAVATVLAAFMGGLALGGFVFGRVADRRKDHLKLYAYLEIGIAIYCVLLPLLFKGITGIYVQAYQAAGASFYVMSLVRFFLCALVLLLPTTFMGATLPILSRYVVKNIERFGSGFGRLYGINTLGAVIGCFVTGYFLIGSVGVWKTILFAAAINLIVALLAWRLHASEGDAVPSADEEATDAEPAAAAASSAISDRVLLLGVALAGFSSLVYEVAWTRLLALVLGSSVYAFTAMLTTFLLGIALGSMVISYLADRIRNPFRGFVLAQVLVAVSTMILTPQFDRLPRMFLVLYDKVGGDWWSFQLVQFTCTLIVMLLPTIFIGAALPLAAKAYTHRVRGLGRSVGTIYASNTVGAIVGSFMGGFVLLPLLGTQNTIVAASAVNMGIAILVFLVAPRSKIVTKIAGAAAVILLFSVLQFTASPWDRYLLNAGLFDSPRFSLHGIAKEGFTDFIYSYDIRSFEEGTYANVAVSEEDGSLFLQINGRTEASTTGDMANQILVSQIPMLLHPDPKDVLVIGLGSGITFGSVLTHPVDEADCVEISPAVVRAAVYFKDWHGDVTRNPRAHIVMDDGRNYLLSTRKKYDVIISEPSKPWISGVSNMFTRETYELAKGRLKEKGLICQWFHYYSMDPEDFKTAVRTFLDVFPYAQLWNADNNVFMVGSNEPIEIDCSRLRSRMDEPKIGFDLKRVGVLSPYNLLGYFLFAEIEAREFVGTGRINTDDLPIIEFSAPRHRNSFRHEEILDSMLRAYPKYNRYPLTGHISHENGVVEYTLASFRLRSPVEWQGGVATMVRNTIDASRLDEDEKGVIVAYRAEAQMTGPGGEELGITAFSRGGFTDEKLELTIQRLASGIAESGAATVHGHSARWGIYAGGPRPMVGLTWYCEENSRQYLIREVAAGDRNPRQILDDLLEGSLCIHEQQG